VFAERVSQGFYINVDVNRATAARYGLTVEDVQLAVTSGIGGETSRKTLKAASAIPSTSVTSTIFAVTLTACAAGWSAPLAVRRCPSENWPPSHSRAGPP
jgi:hypothetical protein